MTIAETPLIHVAGPLVDGIQRCERCGVGLKDIRRWTIGREAPAPIGLQVGLAYPEGALVEVGRLYQAQLLVVQGASHEAQFCLPSTVATQQPTLEFAGVR